MLNSFSKTLKSSLTALLGVAALSPSAHAQNAVPGMDFFFPAVACDVSQTSVRLIFFADMLELEDQTKTEKRALLMQQELSGIPGTESPIESLEESLQAKGIFSGAKILIDSNGDLQISTGYYGGYGPALITFNLKQSASSQKVKLIAKSEIDGVVDTEEVDAVCLVSLP